MNFTNILNSWIKKSGEDDTITSKIDEKEEHDEFGSMSERKRPSRISNPIHISHHTVSGHEAMNLAKRLSEELAVQSNQTGSDSAALNLPRAMSPDCEPISRSFEVKSKGNLINWGLLLHNVDVSVVQWSAYSMAISH